MLLSTFACLSNLTNIFPAHTYSDQSSLIPSIYLSSIIAFLSTYIYIYIYIYMYICLPIYIYMYMYT